MRELSITYDKEIGQLETRLVVQVKARENKGTGRVAVDLGETYLMACTVEDGTVFLYSGRFIKIGDLTGIREAIDYGAQMNQCLHAWPYRKLADMLRYKAELVGIDFITSHSRRQQAAHPFASAPILGGGQDRADIPHRHEGAVAVGDASEMVRRPRGTSGPARPRRGPACPRTA